MERTITVTGISKPNPYTVTGISKVDVINFYTVFYTFESKNVDGLGCGSFSLTEEKLAYYDISLGCVYNACFSYDAVRHKQKLEGLFNVEV